MMAFPSFGFFIAAFLKTDFYRLYVEKDAERRNLLKFQMTATMPDCIPLIIGDAIHNLRAALDLAACEIVVLAGEEPTKWTHFPVRETRQKVEETINGGQIKIAGADIVNLILDVIKPYQGGNDPLHALHSLDITDKHKLLIPLVNLAGVSNVNVRFGTSTMTNCSFISTGGVINILSTPEKVDIEGNYHPAFDILFDKGQAFEGKAVIPTLHKLSEVVAGALYAIEQAYLARSKRAGG